MPKQPLLRRLTSLLAVITLLLFSGWANADPPSRVARLGYVSGGVIFSPAGESEWMQATLNRPLTTGDRLWTETDARAELQVGGAMVRMDTGTGVAVLNLDDRITQLQLTQGTLHVRVHRLAPGQVVEVDTPHLALTLQQPGTFRMEVDPYGDSTAVFVSQGEVVVHGDGASYLVDARQAYRFRGTGLRDVQAVYTTHVDDFDRWAAERDRAFDRSVSARYVSADLIGYQDLDAYGTWGIDATYGNVWFPTQVVVGWVPYRDGHWVWIAPWGWTWVDDAPWGFAVTHYGRWAHLRGRWGWVPGPVRSRAYYAPALVVFVGGVNFQITISSGLVGGVAWFPLAPHEVYLPPYPVSRDYFSSINLSNTVINTTVINNYYSTTKVTNIVYNNRRVPGAVVAVPKTSFVQSRPVGQDAVALSPDTSASAPVAIAPPLVPTDRSAQGAASPRAQPPARVFERPVIVRTPPPAAQPGPAAQQPQRAEKPVRPPDEAARRDVRPAVPAQTPNVRVVPSTREATRTLPSRPATREQVPVPLRGRPSEPQPPTAPRALPHGTAQPPAAIQPADPRRARSQEELEDEARKRGQ